LEVTVARSERTVHINRPIDEVFAYFADSENDPQWRQHVKEIKRTGPVGPGMSYRQRIAGPGGRAIPSDFTVTTYEPPLHLEFEVTTGPVLPRGDYRFAPIDGATDVTLQLEAQLSGAKKLLMERAVQKAMDSEVASLDRAKQVLESRS
jgi:uncharacterized membrane protein